MFGVGKLTLSVVVGAAILGALAVPAVAQTGPPGFDPKAFEDFRKCLEAQGVTLPEQPSGQAPGGFPGGGPPGGGFPGGGDAASQKAREACASKLPEGLRMSGGGQLNPEAFQAYASCLKDHGVKVSQPKQNKKTKKNKKKGKKKNMNRAIPNFNRNDPDFAAANEICAPLLPEFPSPSTTTPEQ